MKRTKIQRQIYQKLNFLKIKWKESIKLNLLNILSIIYNNRVIHIIEKTLKQEMIWDILQQSSFSNYFASPQVDTLTIQTLLLDENIITEFKNMNPELIQQYLFIQNDSINTHKDEFITKLIEYTITMPTVNDSEDRIKKLPYVSSELLAIDNQIVYNSLLGITKQNETQKNQQKDYFLELMKIFQTQSCKNEILMGYFLKIVTNLYKCQKKAVFFYLFSKTVQKIYSHRQVLYLHLNDESVGTIFEMFLILLETEQGYMLNQRKQIIDKLISFLVEEQETIKSVCKNILTEVIARFQTFSSGDQLKDYIIQSQKLLNIFEIKKSQAIDKFIIGYLTKALQKICTAGDQQKSLLQIPQIHRLKIASYINLKKDTLTKNQSGQSFKNQTQNEVHRFSKSLSTYLTIIKLALQNSITGFLNQQDIKGLFEILSKHPTNDIVKVKIFDIFSLIFMKKDQSAQNILSQLIYDQSIRLFQQDKKMYGYSLYLLWKNVNKKLKNTPKENQIQKWNNVLKYFQLNQNYQKDAQKVVDRYSNRTKVIKLVVDQEDTGTSQNQLQKNYVDQKTTKQSNEKVSSVGKQPQKPKNDQNKKTQTKTSNKNFDIFSPVTTFPTKVDVSNKLKTDPFAAFDFFGSVAKKEQKITEEKQQKKQEKKKADFSNFASFF